MTGMLSAAIYTSKNTCIDAILKSWQLAFILSIVFVYAIFQARIGYTFGRWIVASLIFIGISNGNTFFGLLKLEFLRVLGLISYSIYLMHGVIMAFLFGIMIKGVDYSYSMIIAGPMVVFICSLTYSNIELRFSSQTKRNVIGGKA